MNHVVEFENPAKEVAAGATPSAQYNRHPISPATAYSMTFVIQAMIMNDVTASAAWVLASIPIGMNHSKSGIPTVATPAAWRANAFCGIGVSAGCSTVLLLSMAVIGLSRGGYLRS
jgi:hypothetical protein